VVVRLRSTYVVTGRAVSLQVPKRLKRIAATFSVDGRSHRVAIALR
jgi:hypothetical protein